MTWHNKVFLATPLTIKESFLLEKANLADQTPQQGKI
jgi:hypothetical protein